MRKKTMTDRKTILRRLLLPAIVAVVPITASAPANALEITRLDATVSTHQAGAHPDSTVDFAFALRSAGDACDGAPSSAANYCVVVGGAPRDLSFDLPKGLVGSTRDVARCTEDQLARTDCPIASQVGYIRLHLIQDGTAQRATYNSAVSNMVPLPGEAARLGFRIAGAVNSYVSLRVRNGGDYGLTATTSNIFSGLPVTGAALTIWGSPSDISHDAQRYCPETSAFGCSALDGPLGRPFMTNPAECDVPGNVTMRGRGWGDDDSWVTGESTPESMEGCDREVFKPTVNVTTSTTSRGAPVGFGVNFNIPDTYDNPNGLATPPLRNAVVTLPQGMTLSPASADGLVGCSDSDMHFGQDQPAACPQASQVGTVTVTSPLISESLTGGIYLGTQESDDPTSGRMFRIAMELKNDERGIDVKLPGQLSIDPDTGQITARFNDNPQLAISTLNVTFKAGPRAPLALPSRCGTYYVHTSLTSWATGSDPVVSDSPVDVNQNCTPLPFGPSMTAGVANAAGGAFSTFSLDVNRQDGMNDLSTIEATLPEGLLGVIASVPLCPEAQAAAGTCGAQSQVGHVAVSAGAGSSPLWVPQAGKAPTAVYLAGPYKGAPYSLSIVVPAQAGPFDLGTVVVRAGIYVDNRDAHIVTKADPLPQVVKGIPLRVREVRVVLDRPGFMFNPTDCTTKQIVGVFGSVANETANAANRFRVGSCAALPFKPRMTLRVGSRGHTARGRTTPLSVTLAMTRGQANNRVVRVKLPTTLNAQLDVVSVRNACSLAQYAVDRCPQQVGSATAVTPLLRQPLRGRVFLVRNPARRLPDMMVRLRGQGDASLIDIDLAGKITIPKDLSLQTTFDTVPDVPITNFRLNLVSGRNAPVGTVSNLCTARARRVPAKLSFTAQSGKKVSRSQKLKIVGCGKTVKEKRRAAKHKKRGGRHSRAAQKKSSRAGEKHARS
jgi:hypothetical protein